MLCRLILIVFRGQSLLIRRSRLLRPVFLRRCVFGRVGILFRVRSVLFDRGINIVRVAETVFRRPELLRQAGNRLARDRARFPLSHRDVSLPAQDVGNAPVRVNDRENAVRPEQSKNRIVQAQNDAAGFPVDSAHGILCRNEENNHGIIRTFTGNSADRDAILIRP